MKVNIIMRDKCVLVSCYIQMTELNVKFCYFANRI